MKKVGHLLAEKVLNARSDLYRWMYKNHAEIAPILRVKRSWQALADTAAQEGIRTITGAVPSRQAVRKTWQQVEQDLQAEAQGAEAKPKPRTTATDVPAGQGRLNSPATQVASPPPHQPSATTDKPQSRFKPVSLGGHSASKEKPSG